MVSVTLAGLEICEPPLPPDEIDMYPVHTVVPSQAHMSTITTGREW